MPGLVIEESDDEAEVEAETKVAEGIAGAFERMSGHDQRQYLSNEFVYEGDLDFDSGGLGSKGVLGKSRRVEDPTLGGSSLEGNGIR